MQSPVPSVVVYTAVFGSYDDPPVVHQPDPAVDYLFFTEEAQVQLPAPWQVRVVPRMFEDPQRDARRIKLLPHVFVAEYAVSVWVDANCELLDLNAAGALALLEDADLAVPSHQERSCIYDESETVLELRLDLPEIVTMQMAGYRSLGFPAYFGLHTTMFLVRRHLAQACRVFSDAWWRELQGHSKRDQLSFDFVRWKFQTRVRSLPLSCFGNPVFQWNREHKASRESLLHLQTNVAGSHLSNGATRVQEDPVVKPLTVRVRQELAARGYAQPMPVFSAMECRWLMGVLDPGIVKPETWHKGWAVTKRSYYDVAVDWRILSHVMAVLGDDVVLWGASLVHRVPGEVHPWHSDIESSAPAARTVSVWIGLQGTCAETSLKMAPGSHELGFTVQEKAAQRGKRRHEIQDDDIAAWAKECGATEEPHLVPMQDGEALFFDGRSWHGSNNLSPHLSRTAILLQYAAGDTPIRMPAIGHCEWPFNILEHPLPPCLAVKGATRDGVNRITQPPLMIGAQDGRRLRSAIFAAPREPLDPSRLGWASHSHFRGFTAGLADLICHMSALQHGKCPHQPYQHPEEEIFLVLEGEVEMHFPELRHQGKHRQKMQAGDLTYIPGGLYHTLTTTSVEPARYVMLRWISDPLGEMPPLKPGVFTIPAPLSSEAHSASGWSSAMVFEGATTYLSKLHCHVTLMDPGAGYEPHIDGYDVVLIILEGEVSCFGGIAGAGAVIFCAAGEPHGLKNAGSVPARYLVLEFHAGKMMMRRLLEEGVLVD